jgi:hypothetical protein
VKIDGEGTSKQQENRMDNRGKMLAVVGMRTKAGSRRFTI